MAARMDPARIPSSAAAQPSPWGWRSGAWGWGADEADPTVGSEHDAIDGYAISGIADTGPAAGSSASLIVRFLSEFLSE